jgi:hypothetical protein
MNPIANSAIVLAFACASAICGALLRAVLPNHHLSDESKDAVKLATGLVASMVALILGLLVWSSKSFFDTQSAEITKMSAQAVVADRALAHYGPEANHARDLLRARLTRILDQTWSHDNGHSSSVDPAISRDEALYDAVNQPSPQNDAQRSTRATAISIMLDFAQTRWLIYEQTVAGVPQPLFIALVFWLSILFLSFGWLAPANGTVAASLFLSALSLSAAILMTLEMYSPYRGLIQVSSAPMRAALAHLGK